MAPKLCNVRSNRGKGTGQRSNPRRLAESAPPRLQRLNHRPDVTVLENPVSALSCSSDNDIDHGRGQVVGADHLVREQHPKRRIHHAQQSVAEIRLPSVTPRGRCTRAGRGKRGENPLRAAPSRPRSCRARRGIQLRPVGPRRCRSGMRTPRRDCYCGERAQTRSVVHRYGAELRIRYSSGIRAQAIDRGVLTRERLRKCGAVGEVLVQKRSSRRWVRRLSRHGSHALPLVPQLAPLGTFVCGTDFQVAWSRKYRRLLMIHLELRDVRLAVKAGSQITFSGELKRGFGGSHGSIGAKTRKDERGSFHAWNPTARVTLFSLGVGLAILLAGEFMHYRGQKRARPVAVSPITKHVNCRRPGAYK